MRLARQTKVGLEPRDALGLREDGGLVDARQPRVRPLAPRLAVGRRMRLRRRHRLPPRLADVLRPLPRRAARRRLLPY